MASVTRRMATIDDLSLVEGKAELIAGEIVPPHGRPVSEPNLVAGEIFLRSQATCEGHPAKAWFTPTIWASLSVRIESSGRESFSH